MTRICMIALALTVASLAGCGDSHGGSGIEPEYTGCGTDEIWRTFDDQGRLTTPADSDDAPAVTAPMTGTTVPFDAPPTWSWTLNGTEAGTAAGNVPHDCPQYRAGGTMLTPAHEPPISGDVFDLRFSVGEEPVWRVITTLQQWTPDGATGAWSKMRGKTVTLRIWRMSVLRNDVKDGPFARATPFTFTVGN